MTPFFATFESQHALLDELESWRGTPFVNSGAAGAMKGYRSNCVTFVEGVFRKLGAVRDIEWPKYVVAGGGEPMLELLIRSLKAAGLWADWHRDSKRPLLPELMLGDVILVSTGRKLHHLAIYSGDNTVWHSTKMGRGVCTGNVFDPLIQKHAHSVWRAYAA